MLLPPRIQLLLCREYNESLCRVLAMPELRPSNHALGDLNVTRQARFGAVHEPFSYGFFSSDSAGLGLTGAQPERFID
jgi:hypothetical protein